MFRQMTKEKESGMDKLIELLNEYENRDLELGEGEESNARTENNGHLRFNGANKVQFDTYMFDSLALSKKYGFIKWLVENEKIDTESYCRITSIERKGEKDVYRDEVDSLLMLLSIQYNPIEFLVSILK